MQVAVVGGGRWGRLHATKLAVRARVVAVVDRDLDRANRLGTICPEAAVLTDVSRLPAGVEAVSIAVNLPNLAPVARACLKLGKHVFLEKPAAASVTEACGLRDAALAAERLLAVGFVERFNPALAPFCPSRVAGQTFIARRVGPGLHQAGPVDLDWLVHDLDLARYLLGPLTVRRARFSADRAWIELLGQDGRRARVVAAQNARAVWRGVRIDRTKLDLRAGGDALGAQFDAFLRAVRGAPEPRLARIEDAIAVLRLLEQAHAERVAA